MVDAHPEGAEVAGDEAGEDVERRAAFRDAVTTSCTCADSVEVKTLTNSGMIAPASVPQVMIVASFHHSVVSPPSVGISSVRRDVGERRSRRSR